MLKWTNLIGLAVLVSPAAAVAEGYETKVGDHVLVIVMTTSKLAARENTISPRQEALTMIPQKAKPGASLSTPRPANQTATIVSNPHTAGPRRADHSLTPKTLNEAMSIQ